MIVVYTIKEVISYRHLRCVHNNHYCFFYTIPVMSVHIEDKQVKIYLKESESCLEWKSVYTIPVLSVHTKDKEVQGLFERMKVTIWLESSLLKVHSIPYQCWMSILKIQKWKSVNFERKSQSGWNHRYWKSILYSTSDDSDECLYWR